MSYSNVEKHMIVPTILTEEVKNAIESIFIIHKPNAFYLTFGEIYEYICKATECFVYCLVFFFPENYVTTALQNYLGYSRHVYYKSCELNR